MKKVFLVLAGLLMVVVLAVYAGDGIAGGCVLVTCSGIYCSPAFADSQVAAAYSELREMICDLHDLMGVTGPH